MNPLSPAPSTLAAPFDSAAHTYDSAFEENFVTCHLRTIIWERSLSRFRPGEHVLDLNCGTGTDALHLSRRGVRVTGIDASQKMIEAAGRKAAAARMNIPPVFRRQAFEELRQLDEQFDGVLSNFGGLNCTADLGRVLQDVAVHIRRNGSFVLCLMNRWYPWEILSFTLRGKPDSAVRRLRGSGTDARIGLSPLRVWYYSPSEVIRQLKPWFAVERMYALSVITPPPNSKRFIDRRAGLVRRLMKLEDAIRDSWPFSSLGDHFVIEARRTST